MSKPTESTTSLGGGNTSSDGSRGFGKVIDRVRAALRRTKTKKGKTPVPASTPPVEASTPAPIPPSTPKAPATTKPTATSVTPQTPASPPITHIDRTALFAERAAFLSEKFGLELKAPEWYNTPGTALRMEKPIRMRVRRTCHLCDATFGSGKECLQCQHVRCDECSRYPSKRTDAEREASRLRVKEILEERKRDEGMVIAVDWRAGDKEERLVLRKPNKVAGKPDLVYRKPRQRVRRHCHECKTLFVGASRQCANCQHVRCTDCPRDPAKKDKYPFGYPGDVFGPSSVPVHACHSCKKHFPAGIPDGTPCEKCSHEKCTQCLRLKPQKVVPEPDEDILAQVEAKLAMVKVE